MTAAQPTNAGTAPAAPPMTIFCFEVLSSTEWSDKNKTLSVTAMNFNELPIQKKIYLSISENSKKEYIDLFKILQLSDLEFAGLNG